MKYPLENLTDTEFENLVALICSEILGTGTVVFSDGQDGGRDAEFNGMANNFPSKSKPWSGKIIIQAKHTQRNNASCSESDFQSILKTSVIPSIQKLKDESLDIMGSWFSGNSRCGLNEFHFGSEVNEETIRLNNTWSDLIKKLNIMIRNL